MNRSIMEVTMTARQTDKRRRWERQLYVTAEWVDAFMPGHTGVCYRTDFHPRREPSGHIKAGFGRREIEILKLTPAVILSRCPGQLTFK